MVIIRTPPLFMFLGWSARKRLYSGIVFDHHHFQLRSLGISHCDKLYHNRLLQQEFQVTKL